MTTVADKLKKDIWKVNVSPVVVLASELDKMRFKQSRLEREIHFLKKKLEYQNAPR